jgi:hypothetical protein
METWRLREACRVGWADLATPPLAAWCSGESGAMNAAPANTQRSCCPIHPNTLSPA